MLLDIVPVLQSERVEMGVRIVGTLGEEDRARALELLKAKGALDDSRNRYAGQTSLWCGHERTALVEVPDGKSGKTQICSLCEPEAEAAPYVFHPFNVRKPK